MTSSLQAVWRALSFKDKNSKQKKSFRDNKTTVAAPMFCHSKVQKIKLQLGEFPEF
jgi:hypothetical protein